MNRDRQLEKLIKRSLLQEVDNIEAGMIGLEKIKHKIYSREERKQQMMKRINHYLCDFKYKITRPAALVYIFAVAAIMLCTFSQPVKVMAQEGIKKVTSFVYIVVKGDTGKYESVQVSSDKVKIATSTSSTTSLEDKDLAKEAGFEFNAPRTLEGGYELFNTAISRVDSSGEVSIAKYYQKEETDLVLNITDQEHLLQYAQKVGDNKKEIRLKNHTLYYCENPLPIYPLVEKNGVTTNDITQKPKEIKVVHSLTWEYKGVYYHLSDMGNNISLDKLKNAANSVLNN